MKMPKLVWLLVIGMAVNVTGASFIWPLNTIYIHNELGKSLSVAGIVLMLNSGASVIGNLIGGQMFDRFGGYLSVMTGIMIALASLVGMVVIHSWPWYPVWLILVGFGSGIVFPSHLCDGRCGMAGRGETDVQCHLSRPEFRGGARRCAWWFYGGYQF